MGLINNTEVLGKLRQVLNELFFLKQEETARSVELFKKLDMLNEKLDKLEKKLNSHTTMMELLGKKVGELEKMACEHYESFVKMSEVDSKLFRLIVVAVAKKKMDSDEASAEPELTDKAEDAASGNQ